MLESIAFSPDGTRVATGGEEEVVRVFDAADGRQHAALFTGATQVSGLAFSPDGRRLYAAGLGDGRYQGLRPGPRSPRPARRLPRESDRGHDLRSRGPRVLQADWLNGCSGRCGPGRWQRTDRSDPPRDRLPPLAPRGLRLQPRRQCGSRRRRDETATVVSGSGTSPSGGRSPCCGDRPGRSRPSRSAPTARSLATAAVDARPSGRPTVTLWHLASRPA